MKSFAFNSAVATFANASVHLANYAVIAGIAAIFGATRLTDAFFLALAFPAFFVGAIVNAVGSVFIPVFSEYKIKRPHMLGQLAGSTLLLVLVTTVVIAICIAMIAPSVISLATSDEEAPFQELVVQQTLLMLPVIVLQTLTGVMSALYNVNERFWFPPITDAISTLSTLVVILVARPALGIFSIPLGFVFAAAVHLLLLCLLWPSLNIKLAWKFKLESELRRSLTLSFPLILGTAALQLGTVISRFLAAQLPPGSVTILDYASRISYGVMELLTSGVLLVVLAKWSQAAAGDNTEQLRQNVKKVVLMMSFMVIPVVVVVIIFRQSLIALAFERGNFTGAMTASAASVLIYYLLGIPVDAIGRIYVRLFLAWQNTWIIGGLAVVRVLVTIIASIILMQIIGLHGLALADNLALLLITIILVYLAIRRLGNTFSGSGPSFIKIGISAMGAGVASMSVGQILHENRFLEILGAGMAGCITYIVISTVLRSDQVQTLVELLTPASSKDVSI